MALVEEAAAPPPASILSEVDRALLAEAVGASGELRFGEPMSRHTTLRIGGPVDAWAAPAEIAAAQSVRALCALHNWPCRAVGAGSNLLVRDGGIRGVVLSTARLRKLAVAADTEGATVSVQAGVSTGKLLSEATRASLGGVEFLGGVPGTVGGGLVMNAGTYLGEFKDVTRSVTTVDARGQLVVREAAACGFVYRGSAIPHDELIVEGELVLRSRPAVEIEAAVRELRDRRKAREPHGVANAGSIFKNPPGDFAGRLIEACGLKGRRVGDAEIAPVHANWIVNTGHARAVDLLALVEIARAEVRRRFGVELELEVKVVGEP